MWSWKLKSSKECVTTHESNVVTLKMDGVYPRSDTLPLKQIYALQRVGGRGDCCEGWLWSWLEQSLVQILAVVAITLVEFQRAEVGKGFVVNAKCHEWANPKRRLNCQTMPTFDDFQLQLVGVSQKGIWLKFQSRSGILWLGSPSFI